MGRASREKRSRTRVTATTRLDAVLRGNRLAAVETRAVQDVNDAAAVLRDLRRLPGRRAALDARQRELVDQARALGVDWGVIGAALMVTPQAVHKRYGS